MSENSAMVLYEGMCASIAQCAAVDEAAGIKDRAAQLEAYARVRDNPEAERQFAEIRLRASIRIGELSRELEKAEAHGGKICLPTDGKSKADQLALAGISTSTAQRYEELAGGREEQAREIVSAAAEVYFAEQRDNEVVPTYGGLKTAIRSALVQTFGERPARKAEPKHEPNLLIHFLYSANHNFEGPMKGRFEPATLALQVMEDFAQDYFDACRGYLPLLQEFIENLQRRFPDVS